MRNVILQRVALTDTLKPIAEKPTIATVTLLADPGNSDVLKVGDGKSDPIDLSPGVQVQLERVDLSQVLVSGKESTRLFMVGWAGD
jgi:hypothetical protein